MSWLSKKQADAHAVDEFEQFAARRRALLEQAGAREAIGSLVALTALTSKDQSEKR